MVTYYAGLHPNPEFHDRSAVWIFDGNEARAVHTGQVNKIASGTPPNVVVDGLPGWIFEPLRLAPGQFYPRIARPSVKYPKEFPGNNPEIHELMYLAEMYNAQLIALKEQLERIFRVVVPTPSTMSAFGHEIRNVLILACTEVESQWKGVLVANGVTARNTHDYVKLAAVLQLRAYEIALPHYPWVDPVKPFEKWVISSTPSKDLPWYHAYNGVKHDREMNFPLATLENALLAICACYAMMCATFGNPNIWARDELRSFFRLSGKPSWPLSECYSNPTKDGGQLTPVNYPF